MDLSNISVISDDLEKLEKIEKGNIDEFSSLFRRYYEPLYFFAGRFVNDRTAAESIVQDVFVKLWEERDKLNIQTNLKAYLYTSVKNSCINLVKRENFFSSVDEDAEYEDEGAKLPSQMLEEKELAETVNSAIQKLPSKCRQIFMMSKFDLLSYQEIADLQDISINTVKTQLKRAVKYLAGNLNHLRAVLVLIQFTIWYYLNK